MASVLAANHQPAPSLASQHAPSPSKKRPADSPLENEQRLSKRFDLLNLENDGARLYIPVPGSGDPATAHRRPQAPIATPHPLAATIPLQKSPARHRRPRPPRSIVDDDMQVEDTPHRVYISDLSAELSDIESDEENPIFLPDIEKHLSRIPRHVLLGPEPKPTEHNQVVLYNVPSSLTVPADQDGVRKAIVEARQRIRDRQASAVTEPERVLDVGTTRSIGGSIGIPPLEDSDAMEID